jgi:hypothetical protein
LLFIIGGWILTIWRTEIAYTKKILTVVFSLLLLFASFVVGSRHGFTSGVDFQFNQCYNIGGVVVDSDTGKVIECSPLGQIPPQEFEQFKKELDKKDKAWYNNT